MIQAAKIIGTGIATTGLIGAGVGIGYDSPIGIMLILGGVVLILVLSCIGLHILKPLVVLMPMPGVRCPTCAAKGIEQWVLPGKHCPRCSTACRTKSYDSIITLVYLYAYGFISISTVYQLINFLFF